MAGTDAVPRGGGLRTPSRSPGRACRELRAAAVDVEYLLRQMDRLSNAKEMFERTTLPGDPLANEADLSVVFSKLAEKGTMTEATRASLISWAAGLGGLTYISSGASSSNSGCVAVEAMVALEKLGNDAIVAAMNRLGGEPYQRNDQEEAFMAALGEDIAEAAGAAGAAGDFMDDAAGDAAGGTAGGVADAAGHFA